MTLIVFALAGATGYWFWNRLLGALVPTQDGLPMSGGVNAIIDRRPRLLPDPLTICRPIRLLSARAIAVSRRCGGLLRTRPLRPEGALGTGDRKSIRRLRYSLLRRTLLRRGI